MTLTILSSTLLLALAGTAPASPASPALAGDDFSWPQWDGPARNGISTEAAWNAEAAEKPLWTAELGLGYSTVAVQDGRLMTMGYDVDTGLDTVFCFDAVSGEKLWSHSYPSEIWNRAHEGGTVNTPSFDGDRVYSMNRESNLFCFSAKDGEILWHTLLKPEDNPQELEIPTWGYSASPLVLDERLIMNCGRLVAVDKDTGEVQWVSEDYGHAYGTPIQFELEGESVIAVMNGNGLGVVTEENGIDLAFHEFGGKNRGVNASTPVLIDGDLFICSGTKPGCARLAMVDDSLEVVWENREMVCSFSGPVNLDGHLYGFDGSILKCVDPEGNTTWQERGIGNGAVCAAGDRLLIMGGTGELIVAEANPEEFKVLARRTLFEEGRFWTKPILVNGIVYCRSSKGAFVALDHRIQPKKG